VIRDLGAWVLRTAMAQAAAWRARGHRVQMSVNISARQLVDPVLLQVVTDALARYDVPAAQLVLEITETALMVDPLTAGTTLQALRDLGATVAVDDFGTGYASLSYLRRFPVQELKIDRSFVAAMSRDDGDRAIVAGCVQLARALGLTSVAEGVETQEQRDALLELGCDLAQGYLFSRPLPAHELLLDDVRTVLSAS
jgi:EAL domain-containing protein (putative c-di-GMP-specific phosphodiesterase class I)